LTGLTSLPHLRSRLDEVYRDAERRGVRVSSERALVVVESDQVARRSDDGLAGQRSVDHSVAQRFGTALRMAEVADSLRAVFSGGETVARAGVHRGVALVRRHPDLAAQVESLRQLLKSRSAAKPDRGEQRVWIEGLPGSHDAASVLLDELAR
jgi:histidine ammonia-lyase